MIVLDTHAWLWWRGAPQRLSREAARTIERADIVGVSAMSCWELAMLDRDRRISFDRGIVTWIRAALADERTMALDVTTEIAVRAGSMGSDVEDPADRLIYSTAAEHGVRLLSRDDRLRALDPARVVW